MVKGNYIINTYIEKEDGAYFVPANREVLIKYSFERQEEIMIKNTPPCSFKGLNPYIAIQECDNKIVIIPNHSDKFLVYNIVDGEFNQFNIPMDNIECHPWGYFSRGYVYKDNVYVVGYIYPGIVKINIQDNTCKTVVNLSNKDRKDRDSCFSYDSVVINNNIFMLVKDENMLFKYDMQSESEEWIELQGDNDNQYLTIAAKGNSLWMVGNQGSILVYNTEEREFFHTKKRLALNSNKYIYSIISDNYLLLGADNEAPLFMISIDNRIGPEILWMDKIRGKGYSIFGFSKNKQGKVIFLEKNTQVNYLVDPKKKQVEKLLIPADTEKLLAMGVIQANKKISENDMSLKEFITYVVK